MRRDDDHRGAGSVRDRGARAWRPAARRGEPGPGVAVGVDLSGPMFGVARRLAAQAGLANARFVRGDAQACPLRPDSFDVMISSFGVMFFDDPAAAFAAIGAALRRGGRLAFLCWQPEMDNEAFSIPQTRHGPAARWRTSPGSTPPASSTTVYGSAPRPGSSPPAALSIRIRGRSG